MNSRPDPKSKAVLGGPTDPRRLAVVHVDLDGAADIFKAHGWPYPWRDDPVFETGLLNLFELCDRVRVTATLFVIASSLDDPVRYELLKEAVRRGHEIASHTTTHADLRGTGIPGRRREIAGSRERLEDRLATPVRGFRAPGYSIDRQAIELVADSGYEYDSSAFPTARFASRLGIAVAALQSPGRPFPGSALVELPLPAYRPLPLPFTPSYSLTVGSAYFRLGFRLWQAKGASFVLLFHLIDLADPLPRNRARTVASRLYTLSGMSAERKRQRCRQMMDIVNGACRLITTAALLETVR